MSGVRQCVFLLALGAGLAACGGSSAASTAECRSGTVSVAVGAKAARLCVHVGSTVVVQTSSATGPQSSTNEHVLHLEQESSSVTIEEGTGGGIPSVTSQTVGTSDAATNVARYKALAPGTAEVTTQFPFEAKRYALALTVRVVSKS